MQIIVRRSEIDRHDAVARVVAYYDDHVQFSLAAHGEGLTVVSLPIEAIETRGGMPTLKADWRDKFKGARVGEPFSLQDQVASVAEMLTLLLENADTTKWPERVRNRRAEFDKAWAHLKAARNASRS